MLALGFNLSIELGGDEMKIHKCNIYLSVS